MPIKYNGSPYWYITYQHGGKRVNQSTGLRNTRENLPAARRLEQEARAESRKLKRGDYSAITFDQSVLAWLDNTTRRDTERPRYALKHLTPAFTGQPIEEITHQAVLAYAESRRAAGASAGTVNRELTVLQSVLTYAIRRFGLNLQNPVSGTKQKERRGKLRWLTKAEYAALLEASRGIHQADLLPYFIALCVYTGMRKQEALGLEWSRVDFDNELIYLNPEDQKNGKSDTIPLNTESIAALRAIQQLRPSPRWVFTHSDGERLGDIKKSFAHACRKARLEEVTPHTLRHTTASWLVQAGIPLAEVQAFLRHEDIRTTMIYAHLSPKTKKASAAALAP